MYRTLSWFYRDKAQKQLIGDLPEALMFLFHSYLCTEDIGVVDHPQNKDIVVYMEFLKNEDKWDSHDITYTITTLKGRSNALIIALPVRMNPRDERGELMLTLPALKWLKDTITIQHLSKINLRDGSTKFVESNVEDTIRRIGAALLGIVPSETIEAAIGKVYAIEPAKPPMVRSSRGAEFKTPEPRMKVQEKTTVGSSKK